ncbi:porin family protein [uncultured Algibacter sp.]|uniref:porin family protein n=1 Tax=uncultured Algibacter sp. TaxID=298659 RepID=UPI002604F64E|nr:porin family protein [uncultured Algibacter sp.]
MKHLKKVYTYLIKPTNLRKVSFYLFFFSVTTSTLVSGQTAKGFGIKGGLNYNSNGDYFESVSNTYKNPNSNSGFHVGVFGKFGEDLYFKPELVYTHTKSDYDQDTFKMQKLDVPLLVGIKVIGPLSAFAGPSFQYILDSKFSGITINDIEKEFSAGLNFGVAFNLKKLGIDLRYERGFSKNEATFINDNIINTENRIDTRPSQLILSVSIIL